MEVTAMVGRNIGRLFAASFAFATCAGGVGQAQQQEVDLQLVLAVDVSRSMDADEQLLQREGYIAAFLHPEVISAIQGGFLGRIAVTYVEWAGATLQNVVVPWTLVDTAAAGAAFAGRLAEAPIASLQRTSISGALTFTSTLFARNGFKSERRVIDVSGDGPNNAGIPVAVARDVAVSQGIVINGLPLLLKTGGLFSFFDIPNLDYYYEDCVIGGAGAFLIVVDDMTEFAQAIRRKIVLEIAGAQPRLLPAQQREMNPRSDCLIGEKMWEEFMSGQE
jgi:hypothetical protein